ncbi:MAG: hypothetical protein JSS84_05920, partial [Bacteroidetes bacterium]|nr:hypothetical protein [Bacteroidota bacterium]
MLSQVKVLAFGLALCMVQGAMAQGFNKRYDAFNQGYEQGAWGIEKDEEGWLIFSFSFEPDTITPDSLIGITSIVLQRINSEGDLVEEKRHKVPEHALYPGWADCCDRTTDGGYVTGGTIENFAGEYKVRLMRYNADGDTLWTRTFGDSTHYWVGNQVKQTTDGGFLIVGFTDAIYFEGGFVIKTDPMGDQEWMRMYGQGGGLLDGFESAVRCGSGYVLGGISYVSEDNSNMWLQRIDSIGDLLWSKRWGGPYDEAQSYALALSDGNILAASTWGYANDGESAAPYLAKVDSADGSTIWEHEYGAPGYGKTLFAAKEFPNTDLIACGVAYDGGNQQGLLLRTKANGDSLWMRNYAYHDNVIDQGTGRFWDVLPTADGGCIAAGVAYNPFGGPYPPGYSQDAWVVKVDSMGCIVPGCDGVGITEQVTNLAGALKLWPNPVQD